MMEGLGIQKHQAAEENMSNLTSASGEASVSSNQQSSFAIPNPNPVKKKRSLPGNPDPDAEVIALSPKSLMATNRFVCEICSKGFQRDQNLQLHRRGHNLPWKLKQRSSKEVRKKVYICPEVACVHHDPSRALGDLTGIKKHFCRKHGEKKWKCDKCSKKYAVQSDCKAHTKICGTREYRCDCGTLFSRRDSFITHRAFCDALAEESERAIAANTVADDHPPLCSQAAASHDPSTLPNASVQQAQFPHLPSTLPNFSVQQAQFPHLMRTTEASASTGSSQGLQELSLKGEHQEQDYFSMRPGIPPWIACQGPGPPLDLSASIYSTRLGPEFQNENQPPNPPVYQTSAATPHLSATALLQKAAQMGASMSRPPNSGQMAAHTISAAGFGLGLSSHQEMWGGGDGGGGHVLKDMMMASMSSAPGLGGGSFGGALGGILGLKREGNGVEDLTRSHGRMNEGGGGGGGGRGGNDGMTRDFLGLRTFSHREILNMAGLDPCMASSSYEQLQENNETWRG
ncbi:zinc finger protein GAI-ASSOCIATED FACTOR 1-like isoform X1 [Phoenix dactylifera]|uniref:Protein EARLY HEADING DATE 2 n=1 Tax=Phoenix dactylifera TaxID=42345 RepID=A0A8B7CVA3_PHODC|nr:zinc finger protein GAI-ASSOCIATED FACTOR 1-like isoform X1 [Phoenix dactylifera]